MSDAIANLQELLRQAFTAGATDVFLMAGESPKARVNGEIVLLDHVATDATELKSLGHACGAPADLTIEHDASWLAGDDLRCRVNLYRSLGRP